MSVIAVAPSAAAFGPSKYGGSGRRCAATTCTGERKPRPSTAKPAAAHPSRPHTATTSPTRAPFRVTGARPCRSPSAVMPSMIVSAAVTSPPTTAAPTSPHSSRKPATRPSTQSSSRLPGAAKPTSRAVGTAPIATMSAKLRAAALWPMSFAVDQSRRKWRFSTSTSVEATTRPSGVATTAASSPGPSSVDGAGAIPLVTRLIRPNAPSSETVMTLAFHSAARPVARAPALRSTGPDDATERKGTNSMAVSAYILIQTEVGKAASVAAEIRNLPGVANAEDVTGPYDVIVRAEAATVDDLGKLVVANVQGVAGITRTLTCPVVN